MSCINETMGLWTDDQKHEIIKKEVLFSTNYIVLHALEIRADAVTKLNFVE